METRRVFHDELDQLCKDVVSLSEMVIEAITKATRACKDIDAAMAKEVIAYDREIDSVMSDIEVRVCGLFALQAPMATDLRTLLTILRIIHDLERSGDHAVNIARAAMRLDGFTLPDRERELLHKMRIQAEDQLRAAMEAFRDGDVAKAESLAELDDDMDDLQRELISWIVDRGEEGNGEKTGDASPSDVFLHEAVQIALVGRYFERIADHAVNIGERVVFMVRGFS